MESIEEKELEIICAEAESLIVSPEEKHRLQGKIGNNQSYAGSICNICSCDCMCICDCDAYRSGGVWSGEADYK